MKLARTIADLAGEEAIKTQHLAEALQYRPRNLVQKILDGLRHNRTNGTGRRTEPIHIHVKRDRSVAKLWLDPIDRTPMTWYPRLSQATPAEANNWQLLGDCYAIEWPDLDEHIGVEGLLVGRQSGESEQSSQRWLSRR